MPKIIKKSTFSTKKKETHETKGIKKQNPLFKFFYKPR